MTQGIFGNAAVGALPQGVFGNQAAGLAGPKLSKGVFGNRAPDSSPGLSGTGGIFTGPTALGTIMSLGATKAQQDQCKLNCMQAWSGQPDEEYNTALCQQNCEYNLPIDTTLEPETSEPEPWYTDGGGGSYDASTGQQCSSSNVIKMVQAAIGAQIDGKWGPESQSKLAAAGGNFKAFAPSCEGAVPSYTGGGGIVTPGGTTPGTTTPGTTPPPDKADKLAGLTGFFSQKFLGAPMWLWATIITFGVAASITAIRMQSDKKVVYP